MLYYVVSIQQVGITSPCSIQAFDNRDAACSAYHSTLASNYIADNLDGFSVVLLNAHGGTEMKEYWVKPVEPVVEGE